MNDSQPSSQRLSIKNHGRDAAGLTYVYPVVSRRAGGVSIGINLNVNNACNWRCIYCQVPELQRGAPPPVDVARIRDELHEFVRYVLEGDFMQRAVPEGSRRLNDIALSGNGEPTSAKEFSAVIEVIGEVRRDMNISKDVKTVLITNGSLVHQHRVQDGLRRMRALSGEVWFKLDSATRQGRQLINDTRSGMSQVCLLYTSPSPRDS